MPSLKASAQAAGGGMLLTLAQQGGPPATAHLTIEESCALLLDVWTALGHYYPKEAAQPDQPRPRCFEVGDASYQIGITSAGFVQLWIRPAELAGIAYDLKPDEARLLAHSLLEGADQLEAFQNPN